MVMFAKSHDLNTRESPTTHVDATIHTTCSWSHHFLRNKIDFIINQNREWNLESVVKDVHQV